MQQVLVTLFLVMYYIRPQEWGGLFSSIRFVLIVMLLALWSLFFRGSGLRLGDLFKTPHDWMVFLFWQWIIWSSGSPWSTFKETANLYIFYLVIVQTLIGVKPIRTFLGWWTFMIVAVAALALLSQVGFDPLGSKDLTEGRMRGRLTLRLSIFDNPNALGHNVVPAIPMLYYFCIWRRPIFLQEVGIGLMFLPLTCIWMTVSKGSMLSGAVSLLTTLTFGRPKWVQAIILALAIGLGGSSLWLLPRMTELKETKGDEAIMGRVAAFRHGLARLDGSSTGIGFRHWLEDFQRTHNYNKAAHSSYVQIGAEQGWPGFLLFLGILYCNLRTLITAKTSTDDEERIRRLLFVLVISYMVSSWMVDLGYRPTFFMFTAAVAAFHRHILKLNDDPDVVEQEVKVVQPVLTGPEMPAWRAKLVAQGKLMNGPQSGLGQMPGSMEGAPLMTLDPLPKPAIGDRAENKPQAVAVKSVIREEVVEEDSNPTSSIRGGWNRIGIIDIGLIILFGQLTVRFWRIVITRM